MASAYVTSLRADVKQANIPRKPNTLPKQAATKYLLPLGNNVCSINSARLCAHWLSGRRTPSSFVSTGSRDWYQTTVQISHYCCFAEYLFYNVSLRSQ